jgi:small conductance mechanosensitive channel
VGDIVSVAGATGVVDAINLRTTVLRDNDGRVHVVPNGTIVVVTNHTRGWARAVVDVPVPYREDVDRCADVLRAVGKEMEKDSRFATMLAAPFEAEHREAAGHLAPDQLIIRTKPHDRLVSRG